MYINITIKWPIIIPTLFYNQFALITRFFTMTALAKSWLAILCIVLVSELSVHECKLVHLYSFIFLHFNYTYTCILISYCCGWWDTGLVNKEADMKYGDKTHNSLKAKLFCIRSMCHGDPCWCCPGKPICHKSKEACDVLCFFKD